MTAQEKEAWENIVCDVFAAKGKRVTGDALSLLAEHARNVFHAHDYPSEEAAVYDISKELLDDSLPEFTMTFSCKNGQLSVSYGDGSDREIYDVSSRQDILDVITEAVETELNGEEETLEYGF